MLPVSLVGESQAGGTIIGPGKPTWRVMGKPISLLGDVVSPHGPGQHMAPVMVEGSTWMRLGGVPVVRTGNRASCDHVANGNPWMNIAM